MWRLFNRDQLALGLDDEPPKNAEELRDRLRRIGLGLKYRVRLTTNRTVVVSYSGGELRIHHSFSRRQRGSVEGDYYFRARADARRAKRGEENDPRIPRGAIE